MMIRINLQQHMISGICLFLVALTCVTLLYTTNQWKNDWALVHQEIIDKPMIATNDERAGLIAAIPEQHLFGQAISKMGAVPITNLQLRVTGIVKTELGKDKKLTSKAYISISEQPSKIYQVGDTLPYGVKVYEITDNAVILENNGRLEKLLLPREKLEFKRYEMEMRS